MEYLDQPFQVEVGSGRRPTPTTYEHLRKYSALELAYLKLSSQGDITNINSILEQTANLYVSNEIHRVIAQVIGKLDPGFITIEGTELGSLQVYLAEVASGLSVGTEVADGDNATLGAIADAIVAAGAVGTISSKLRRVTQGLEDLKSLVVLKAGSATIGNVKNAGSSQTEESAEIDISGTSPNDIIGVDGTKKHHICSIMFTVDGATDVTLHDDGSVTSGPMDFGGTDEPRGLTHNFGQVPLVCGAGKKFQITLGVDVNCHGIVTYYSEL